MLQESIVEVLVRGSSKHFTLASTREGSFERCFVFISQFDCQLIGIYVVKYYHIKQKSILGSFFYFINLTA